MDAIVSAFAVTLILSAVPTTSIVLPVLVKPAPAEICPAPENCSKVILVVQSVGVPFVVRT